MLLIQFMAVFLSHQSPHRHYAHYTMFQSKIQNQALRNDHLGMHGLCCQLQRWKEIPWPQNFHISPHSNLWIFSIISENHIMADSYSDELHWHQTRSHTKKSISLTQWKTNSLSNIHEIWAAFDQVRPIVGWSALFKNKPSTPSDTRKCLRDPHRHHWIGGLLINIIRII